MQLLTSVLVSEYYNELVQFYTDKFGIIGGFILSFIENIFPPLPIFAIVIVNVSSFGILIGFLISFVGHFLGAYVVFIFFRVVLKPRLLKKLKKDSKILKFERWFSNRSFPALLVILSLPFFPYFLINIAAALSEMSKRMYMIALFVGNFLMILYLSVVGQVTSTALASKNYYALIYPILLIVVAYVIGKIFEKKVRLE